MTSVTNNKTLIGSIDYSTSTTYHLNVDNVSPCSNPSDTAEIARRTATIRAARYRSFISYSRDEIEQARRFARLLNEKTPQLTPVFFDERSISPGQNWYDELTAALDTIEFLFVILSPNSFLKHWLHVESGVALARKKHIIPVLHGNLNHKSLEFPYRLFQSSLRLDEGDERLIAGLQRVLPNT